MTMPESTARRPQSLSDRMERLQAGVTTRVTGATWQVLHALGAHRWQEGWEVDVDRGMSRYRGSRCTVCDAPWEGW